ncbi:MAG: imidazoleglycerol-phosphate dehydratase [Firmicutes bacterium]|nr:imidazoleglycerol-phosphate dehydratase [Bacillota bacterium]
MQVISERKTAESEIIVKLDFGPRYADPKAGLKTTMPFLNHMLEHVIWRGEFNLEVSVELSDFHLFHVICEDIGMTLGRAVNEYVKLKREEGLAGYGFALATIDEALARSVISFESRAYLNFSHPGVAIPAQTENTNSEDLQTFFEGFVQGASCTLHLDVLKGENGHHIWEAAFRSFGEALFRAFSLRKWRREITAGVAGPIEEHTYFKD